MKIRKEFIGIAMIILLHIIPAVIFGQSEKKLHKKGIKEYNNEQYDDAAKSFESAADNYQNPIHSFNLGNALYKNKDYTAAVDAYSKSIEKSENERLLFDNYYNRGNANHELENYDNSISDYKTALSINPTDRNAKINLLKSKIKKNIQQKELQKNKEQQQKSQQQNQQGQNNNQENIPENNPENDSSNTQKDKSDGNENNKKNNEEQFDNNMEEIRKSEMDRLLNMVDNEDKKVNKKLKEKKSGHSKSKKDW